jgi:spermidine/putrescine transport system substrate-binding protein
MLRVLGAASVVAVLSCALAAHAAPVELRVFEWEGYISPFADDFAAYAKSKGVEARLAFLKDQAGKPVLVTSADDIFDKVRNDLCDVVTPTNNYYKDSGSKLLQILAPIDMAQVPNFEQIVDNLKKADYAVEGGKRYAVPLLGGGYSLAYNADRVKTPPASWTALFDPAFKGRVSVTNTQYEANVYVAALLNGIAPEKVYSWDAIDQAKVGATLKTLTANVGVYWDSNPDIDKMAKDLDLITDYGFGVAFANAKGQNWKFAQTSEPTTVWVDNISLTPAAVASPEKSKAAHLLLDFMLSPAVQGRIADLYGVVVPNPKAKDMVPEDRRAAVRVGTNDFYRTELMWQPLDRRTRNGFKNLWKDAGGP